MKNIAIILLVLFTIMPVYAAVDSVFDEHERDWMYLGRAFVSEDGAETYWLEYSCLYKGEFWGFDTSQGWVPISELLVLYDYVAFYEEYLDDVKPYNGDVIAIQDAIAWTWPGSGQSLWTVIDMKDGFRPSHVYTDPDGREWGFVQYLQSSRNIWFCISEPMNSDIPAFNPEPPPAVWVSDTPHIDTADYANPDNPIGIIMGLVAGLAVGTVVLIKVLWREKK